MIELSITAKPAAPLPPATPVSGAAPGGFARTLDALADGPPARPDTTEPRHDDAARGKKLPAATADQAEEAGATATGSLPATKAATPTPAMPDTLPVLPPSPPVAAVVQDRASPDDDARPATKGKKANHTAPVATPAVLPVVAAPIPLDPPVPAAPAEDAVSVVTRGAARASAALSLPAARPASAGQDAAPLPSDPAPTLVADTSAAPAATTIATTTTTMGMIALPAEVIVLDPGAPKVTASKAATAGITASRIATPEQTPRFALAPAATAPAAPAPAAAQPARQVFAAALAALATRAPSHDDDDTRDPQLPITGLAAPTSDTLIQAAVQQAADSSQSALDPRHDRGLNGMIDHIEMLRDDADARDTRIRLAPDALGTVDVAVRRDGDAVHVRFSSPNEATRAVLGDAQPRLAALAEARGVRIAGSSIDSGGTGGGNAQPQAQPQPHIAPVRPASASRAAAAGGEADTATMTDQRLA